MSRRLKFGRRRTAPVVAAPIEDRNPQSIVPYHRVEDKEKLQRLEQDMRERGYHGAPIVTWGPYGVTGVHRRQAAINAELETVPTVGLEDVYQEAGQDFSEVHQRHGEPTIDEPGFVPMVGELAPETKAKYGIDIE